MKDFDINLTLKNAVKNSEVIFLQSVILLWNMITVVW